MSAAAGTFALLEEHPRPSSRIWLLAALAALVLHAGCLVFFLYDLYEDDDLAFGAPAIAIDLDLAAPARPATDLPAGPDTEASLASPAVSEQKEVLKETDLPKERPVESEDPSRVVTQDNARKPVEEEQEVKPETPSTASLAAEATAMPSSENIPDSERSTAPVLGIGESTRLVRATWEKEIAVHFNKHKRYPAGRPPRQLDVGVRFEIDRRGRLVSSGIARSSGDAAFDEAALAMLKRADPMPPPPPVVADNGLSFDIIVNFKAPR